MLTWAPSYDDITFAASDAHAGDLSGHFGMASATAGGGAEIDNIICFTPGTRLLTQFGDRPIETLAVGDMVVTRDHGLRPIRWIGRRDLPGTGRFAPVRIAPDMAGGDTCGGLLISPQHRILFTGYTAELLFGESEVLVAAKHLVNDNDVRIVPRPTVTYVHIMFDRHEIIYADGIAAESFHAGDAAITAIDAAAREELFAVFPELRIAAGRHLETARTCLKKREAALLARESARSLTV